MNDLFNELTDEQQNYLKMLVQVSNKEQVAVVQSSGIINSLDFLELAEVINDFGSYVSVRVPPKDYLLFKELKSEIGEVKDCDIQTFEEKNGVDNWGMKPPKSLQKGWKWWE
jgi:hypothetical protein